MSSINAALLEKYQAGRCTPEEREQVERWIAWQETAFPDLDIPADTDENALKDRLWQRMERQISDIPDDHEDGSLQSSLNPWLFRSVAAACVLVLVAFSAWLYRPAAPKSPLPVADAVSYQLFEMPNGKKGKVTLPDGTVVTLNAGSSLRYPSHFSDSNRVVSLSGEAFFEVTKDSRRPFSVYSARNSVRVLGTKFNFKTYPGERAASIAVKEGKVRFSELHGEQGHVVLTVGQQATQEAGKHFEMGRIAEAAAWTADRLAFDNEPMTGIAATLERWYDVKVEIRTAPLRAFRYTGSYADPSLDLVCKQLAFVLKCQYKITGQKVIFY